MLRAQFRGIGGKRRGVAIDRRLRKKLFRRSVNLAGL